MSLKIAAGDASLENSNALKLSRGVTPHGYPAITSTTQKDQYLAMAKRLEKISNNLDATIESTEKLNCELTRARRDFEEISCLVQANLPQY